MKTLIAVTTLFLITHAHAHSPSALEIKKNNTDQYLEKHKIHIQQTPQNTKQSSVQSEYRRGTPIKKKTLLASDTPPRQQDVLS